MKDEHIGSTNEECPTSSNSLLSEISIAQTGLEIVLTSTDGTKQKIRLRPQPAGNRWWKIEQKWSECQWRTVHREPLTDANINLTMPYGGGDNV